jgi:hypothetical protein
MGFLLNGVLADYKESEKLPGELATGLEVSRVNQVDGWRQSG